MRRPKAGFRVAQFLILGYLAACNDAGVSESPIAAAGTGEAAGAKSDGGAGSAAPVAGRSSEPISSSTAGSKAAGSAAVSGTGGSAAGAGAGGAGAGGSSVAGAEAGSGGSAGAAGEPAAEGGDKDGLSAKPEFMPTGMPIMAPDKAWTWVPFPDTKCRAGMPAGLSVNLNAGSKRVLIYLEGGGACFDSQTCGSNPDSVGNQTPGSGGVFDRTRDQNPVKDWNFVYVPYCTGDVHTGSNDNGQVEGVSGTQHFVGRLNLTAFLHRLVPTFSDAEQVLLTGVSAGGFGASSNAAYVQYAFGKIPLTLIDDSGPTFSEKYLPRCLSQIYLKTWGLANSVLDDCGSACDPNADYSEQFLSYSGMRSEGRFNGLIESDQDSIIRGFFGIGTNNGANDCKGTLLVTSMSTEDFLAGLLEYREKVKPYAGFSTFYPSSTQHTWLGGQSFYTATAGGVKLVDWFQGVLEGKPAVHAGH